jgi:diguanylate cyclase (GGDEF)-like protein
VDIRPPGGTRFERRRRTSEEATVPETADAVPDQPVSGAKGLSPVVLAYAVGPVALVLVAVLRQYGLIARLPIWSYVAMVVGTAVISAPLERWRDAPTGSLKLHLRIGFHIAGVAVAIYMSGWGPVLGMAYAFVALEELEQCGAARWRPLIGWTLLSIACGQLLVWFGMAPSFLPRTDAEAIGAIGAFVLVIVIRMGGATGAEKEWDEARLAQLALHDMLTGLPNRACFYERTDEVLRQLPSATTAVLLFDLDRFKEINDTLGHQCGDRVLVDVGPRVREVLRARDLVARLGGDEFCVLLPDVGGPEDAFRVAERIVAVLEDPFEVDAVELAIGASCGIAVAPENGTDADQLLQRADMAMYAAKESSSKVAVYRDELNVNTPAHLALLGDLRTALDRDEFVLHFQPTACMRTHEVCGAEALIRWRHPRLGLLPPDRFVGDAERSGLIEPMTVWVIDAALRQCRAWLESSSDEETEPLSMAVNLSTRSLLDTAFPATVAEALERWQVPGRLLELEITETVMMADPKRARRVLGELADMGVVLAIDDFGTGYSSLAYLRELPVAELKIDRSFVVDMGADQDDAVIVRSVIDLARNLGLCTVAEGVEDERTWSVLAELGCDKAQGYVLAPPMTAPEFTRWHARRSVGSTVPTGAATTGDGTPRARTSNTPAR